MMLSWLVRTWPGQLLLLGLALWFLDNRYLGLVTTFLAAVGRWRRIATLRQAIATNPADVRSMVELGDHYLQGGQPRRAAEHLEQAVHRGEDGPRALFLLGAALVRSDRPAEGETRLRAALAQKPDVGYGEPYLYLLAAALVTRGANSPEVNELVEALAPYDSVEVLTRAGRLCLAAGRRDLARRLFTDAVRNYAYVPPSLRRRQRRWLIRARLGVLQSR